MRAIRGCAPILPRRLYEHLWFHGPFTANVHGAKFLMQHVGTRIENEIFWRNTFVGEHGVTELIASYAGSIDVFLDVGANTGFYSLLVSSLRPSVRTFAFEPSVANLRVLGENVRLNGQQVTIVPAAVTSTDGPISFYDWDKLSYSASVEPNFRAGGTPRIVTGLSLDGFAAKHQLLGKRILLKIDVEGHELAVLTGARTLLRKAAGAVVELLTPEAVKGAADVLGTDSFRFSWIDEASGHLTEMTEKVRAGQTTPGGNYFLQFQKRQTRSR